MPQSTTCPMVFGLAGIVDFAVSNAVLQRQAQELASGFQSTSETVFATWHGDQIAAVAYQHSEDVLTSPGAYTHHVPQLGSYQGILYGHFLSGFEGAPEDRRRSESISQSMVSSYADREQASFTQLNGAWIAIILEKDRRRCVFARDSQGVEALYVSVQGSRIVFASDLRAFALAGTDREYDEQAALEFLHFLYVPTPRTAYTGIQSVLPGHALIIEPREIHQERFAPPLFVQGAKLGDKKKVQSAIQEYMPTFEERLSQAVESCIPRHGQIGLLLSSGKDSSALAVALKQVAPDRVVALTVGSPHPRFDESGPAAQMCEYLGIPHIVYKPSPEELLPGFRELVACQDQPTGDPASLPHFLALGRFPSDVSVIWDGGGNDQYFGDPRYVGYWAYQRRIEVQNSTPRPLWPVLLLLMSVASSRFRTTARQWFRPIEETFVHWDGWTDRELESLCGREVSFADTEWWHIMRTYSEHGWVALHTEALSMVWCPHSAHRKGVQIAQAYGKAFRFPFIDSRLAHFVNSLPEELQFDGFENKILLRAYLAKHLPEDLAQRPKGAFVFDQNLLLQSKKGLLLRWLNEAGLLRAFPWWSAAHISTMITEYHKRPNDYIDKVYALSLLSLWLAASRGHTDWDGLCENET